MSPSFHRLAQEELLEAVAWYEARTPGLGADFLDAVDDALDLINRHPKAAPIIVTVNGVPAFQLAPLEEDDDFIDRLLQYNPGFREYLESRLKERTVSVSEAREALS